jgi:predicted XRE-type DNA-binding protein
MSDEELEFIRGSGNVFRDFGVPDADLRQMKAVLAAAIIKLLDKGGISVRKAEAMTGVAAADFSRIRRADLQRFSLDRLVLVTSRLGAKVEMSVKRARGERRSVATSAGKRVEHQKKVRSARGKLPWTGDLEAMRRD